MSKKQYMMLGIIVLTCSALFYLFARSEIVRMPLTITSFGNPAVTVEIGGKEYLLQVDMGSKFQMSLDEDMLETIRDKKTNEQAKWRDAKGNFYESPAYVIPKVKIGDLKLQDVVVRQESNAYKTKTKLWDTKRNEKVKCVGSLGRPLLEKSNVLLDFQDLMMIACNDKHRLEKAGFSLDSMVRVPFEDGKKGIILKVDTDVGELRLALDTGATITLIRSSRLQDQKCTKSEHEFLTFKTQEFSIGDRNFGSKDLFLYDFTPELEIDGVIGMDFLQNRIIYIDYQNKSVYIGDIPQSKQN